ncbi:MAG: NAD-dependent epimerase/dehydratase family protein [Nanoarchaeota archaeon]
MKFVLTGHKGLIGSFLLERLKQLGHETILLIDARDGENIIDIDKIKLKEKPDVFIHLAAFCKINKTIENPDLAFENNVLGPYKIFEFCRKNKISKIIFASSSRILKEEKNPYTASKIYGEELCKAYKQCYGIDYIIIRPSTVYGPFDDKTGRLVDIFIRNAMQGKELKIYGDENKTLDFTYIDDFVEGFVLAMNQKNKDFDIGSGKETKVKYLADLIIKHVRKGEKIFLEKEIAQPQQVEIDLDKMRELGFKPKVSVEEGIKRTIEWYKNNVKI